MENGKNKVDILQLGKREMVVKIHDPEQPDNYSELRLVRMKKSDAEKAFLASRKAYQDAKTNLAEQEKNLGIFSSLAEKADKKTLIEIILQPFRFEQEQNIDLVEIQDEKATIDELKAAGKSDEEITEELEKQAQVKIEEKIAKRREEYEKMPDAELKKLVSEQLLELEAQGISNEIFTERALCYMCYQVGEDKQVFSDNPEDDRYITKALRSTAIYHQIRAAYHDFLVSLNMTPKQIREQTKRGGDFFTLRK
jgi:hypothetical protein